MAAVISAVPNLFILECRHRPKECPTDTQSVALPLEIPVRTLEAPIFRSAVVKNPTTHPDFRTVSPFQRILRGVRALSFAAVKSCPLTKIEAVRPFS